VPKFLRLFELALAANPAAPDRLVGATLTTADLALFQVLDGLRFAFPRLIASLERARRFPRVFTFHAQVLGTDGPLGRYLRGDARKKYGMGIFRHYEELDGEFEETMA
jgi:glutathione S-transferase